MRHTWPRRSLTPYTSGPESEGVLNSSSVGVNKLDGQQAPIVHDRRSDVAPRCHRPNGHRGTNRCRPWLEKLRLRTVIV